MADTLGPQFWEKLSQISDSLGMNPEDLLTVMYYESGLDPSAHNKNGNASGLIQFMPDTLNSLGYKGSHRDFRDLNAIKQLDYVEKYVRNQMNFNGGPFKSATQYYVANLWPIALKLPGVKAGNPKTVILDSNPTTKRYPGVSIEQEKNAYKANAGLDVDKDGKITYGDLNNVMLSVRKAPQYQQALAAISSGKQYAVGKPQNKFKNNKTPDFWAKIDYMLDQFLAAFASEVNFEENIKKTAYKRFLPQNNILIKINSDNLYDSLEFARILSLALDEELSADASIHTNKKNVEVNCTIHGPEIICQKTVSQLCNSLSNVFEIATKKIGGIKIKTEIENNIKSNYQELDIKLAEMAYRQFHLKFIK